MNVSNQTEETDYWVDMDLAVERMKSGRDQPGDFKKVILEGYFHNLPINQTALLADEATLAKGQRSEVMEVLISISRLQQFLMQIRTFSLVAKEKTLTPEEEAEELERLDLEIANEAVV
tara:strand:- start:324 stop:680 length:357 start_codon:yes stop_codon:yes gene_type:complete